MPRYFLLFCGGLFTLFGVQATSTDGIADIRAMYGGLELAWATALFWHAADDSRIKTGLYLAALSIGSLGVSRLISMGLTEFSTMSVLLMISELSAVAVAVFLAQQAD